MAVEVGSPQAIDVAAGARTGATVSLALLILSVGFAVAGQFTLKAAMNEVGRLGRDEASALGETIVRVAREPRLWVGLALYGISAIFWIIVLSRVPLSLAYPFVGISYVIVVAVGRLFLNEDVPLLRWVGVAVVTVGVVLIGVSFRRAAGT